MTKTQLLDNLADVKKVASVSKIRRLLLNPVKYLSAIFHRELIYKQSRKDKEVVAPTFFDKSMHLLLPSSTDIYLTGGKSHDSEIRLATYLIKNLESRDTFVDVGAHYGYFTLLGSTLVGREGKVYSYEASPNTFQLLNKNTESVENTNIQNVAISNTEQELTFYQFPNFYSEYNTFAIEQFVNKDWYQTYPPEKLKVKCIKLDSEFKSQSLNPKIIKIDVEGAEYQVIKGMKDYLEAHSPIIIMEYLSPSRGNRSHQNAESLLKTLDYSAYIIKTDGTLGKLKSVALHFQSSQIDSDNIVFKKN